MLVFAMPVFAHEPVPSDTAFTYQGSLNDAGSAASGAYNLDFSLWDSLVGGIQIGSTVMFNAVDVTDGLFTVTLDFGADAFDNTARWIEIGVNGTELSPRQRLTHAPYAVQTRGIFVNNAGNVGIGTTSPQNLLHVVGDTNAANAIYGYTTELSNAAAGVYGQSASSNGFGVYGFASAQTGSNYGVFGKTNGAFGYGVFAHASHPLGQAYGVYSWSQSNGGVGVYGEASSSTGTTYGVWGKVRSPDGYAGRFDGRGYFSGNVGFGLLAPSYPVHAYSTTSPAVFATAPNDSAIFGEGRFGVEGTSTDPDGRGVFGYGASITGENYGVYGLTPSETGRGVYGYATSTTGLTRGVSGETASDNGLGVYGYASSPTGLTNGVRGFSASDGGRGISGLATSTTGVTYGVEGQSHSTDGAGVIGRAIATSGRAFGVRGESSSPDGFAMYAINDASTGSANGILAITESINGFAIEGSARATSGAVVGVLGDCASPDGFAFYAFSNGVDYGSPSSIRWKKNVVNIDDPLGKLAQIRGVYYDLDEAHGGGHEVGMIAEEVGRVLPEIVQYEDNGYDAIGMDYSRTTPLLVEAVKALMTKQAESEKDLAAKDRQIEELNNRLTRLETLLRLNPTNEDMNP